MAKSWSENKQFLREIIDEMIVSDNNDASNAKIMDFYNVTMEELYKKQYLFANYTQLNKHVLSLVNDFLLTNQNSNNIQNNVNINYSSQKPTQNVTREELHNERDSIFKERLQEKQREMDMYSKKPTMEIDFADKEEEQNESIDNLLERELALRNQEFEYDNSVQQKASEWITNTTSTPLDEDNVNTFLDNKEETIIQPKLKIYDEEVKFVKPILKQPQNTQLKQVHFKDDSVDTNTVTTNIDSSNTITSNLLLKLNQIKKNREVVEQSKKNDMQNVINNEQNTIIQSNTTIASLPTTGRLTNIQNIPNTTDVLNTGLVNEVKHIQETLVTLQSSIDFLTKKVVQLCSYVEKENITLENTEV